MVSFDTNILVSTLSVPIAKTDRARDFLVRGMRTGSSILLLQTLAEFSSVAIRKAVAFWDAMLWGAAQRAGVRHLVADDLQDGFELAGVRFVNPFDAANNGLIDEILPPR
jgi:predicted nucleic acid-binding protein